MNVEKKTLKNQHILEQINSRNVPNLTKNHSYVHNCLTFFSSYNDQDRKMESIDNIKKKTYLTYST